MSNSWKIIISIAAVVFIILFFWFFSNIVLYVLISGIISLIGQPIMNLLEKIKIGKFKISVSVRALITLSLFWLIFYLIIKISIPLIISQAEVLSKIDIEKIRENISEPISIINKTFKIYNIPSIDQNEIINFFVTQITNFIDISNMSNLMSLALNWLGNFLIAVFSITFITFFFLADNNLFYNMILFFVPDKYDERFLKALKQIQYLLSRYFIGVSFESFLIALLRTLGFTFILGIDLKTSLIISIFSGVINIIPYVGNIIGYIFAVIYIFITNTSLDFNSELMPLLIYMTIIYYVVQLIDNILFQPLIYAKSVKAHALEVFLVILMAGSIGGILGMILAIPLYTIIRVIANEFFSQYKVVRQITKTLDEQ